MHWQAKACNICESLLSDQLENAVCPWVQDSDQKLLQLELNEPLNRVSRLSLLAVSLQQLAEMLTGQQHHVDYDVAGMHDEG